MNPALERARKLRHHAESARAIGSEAEANAFIAKLAQLMDSHGLTEADIASPPQDGDTVDVLAASAVGFLKEREGEPALWEIALANAVGSLTGSVAVFYGTRSGPLFAGRRDNRVAAAHTYIRLHGLAETLSRAETEAYRTLLRSTAGHGNTMGFRESWLLGFAARLEERVNDPNRVRGTGLVTQRQAEADESIRGRGVTERVAESVPVEQLHRVGIARGIVRANDTPLDGSERALERGS